MDEALGQIVATGLGTAVGAVAGGSSGAFTGFNTDRFNRQLGDREKPLARQIAEIAKANGTVNPDGSPISQEQIENAMRSANHSQRDETITSGMVVPLNEKTTADQIYDTTGMKVTDDGAGNRYLVQDPSMLVSPSDVVRNLIIQNSGGDQSPYSWITPSPEVSRKNTTETLTSSFTPFSPKWNTGENSLGLQQPGIKLPDYVSVKIGAFGVEASVGLNLHNGTNFACAGASVPVTPGGGITFGWIPTNYGLSRSEQAQKTDQFLGGGSHSAAVCAWGMCVGGGHAIGGETAIEIGIGAGGPTRKINMGGSAGTGISTPVVNGAENGE
ncbi:MULTISPECIES: hypothetical protein [Pandoraea]|uniref:hypothetical protein n=1 Tax=Pandoraea TaxID=93217 RepID=UPI001F5DAC98|nr:MULTISPECIES: hypothetical protein [Pandoraea]